MWTFILMQGKDWMNLEEVIKSIRFGLKLYTDCCNSFFSEVCMIQTVLLCCILCADLFVAPYIKSLNNRSHRISWFCFPRIVMFPSALAWQNIYVLWKQMKLLHTWTLTQQNEHCDWLILGHVPLHLIKFKCIPTGKQLLSFSRAPNTTACFASWLFKGKSECIT